MKKFFLPLLLSAALSPLLLADVVVTQRMEEGEVKGDMTLKFKGEKVRIDFPVQFSIVIDTAKDETFVLIHPQKMAMKANNQLVRQMTSLGGQKLTFTPLNKSEEVDGYKTDLFSSKLSLNGVNLESTYWVAKDFPKGALYRKAAAVLEKTAMGDMMQFPLESPAVPIKTTTKGAPNGDSTIKLVSIAEESLDDAIFATPADYQVIEAPALPAVPAQ